MTALSQILAVEKGAKSDAHERLTRLHRDSQQPPLFNGIARTYDPIAEDGERFPDESQRVQLRADDVLTEIARVMTRLFDVVATKDVANTHATADVVVEGQTLLVAIPATHLLFLEKQLNDLRTIIRKMLVLSQDQEWEWDEATRTWRTPAVKTAKSKKVPRVLVRYEATDKHPAQTDVWQEDVLVGYWTNIKLSGALSVTRAKQLLERVQTLADAVKVAREEANKVEVVDQHVGQPIFDYLFAE